MSFPGFNIHLKKGDPAQLKGKLIAYVLVQARGESVKPGEEDNSLEGLVRNGILAVQGNYVDQRNIRDFFKNEFGISLEKGIQEVIEQAKETGGLEGALDPEAVKERLESMKNADFIPIPAKVAFFPSEDEMLNEDADIYFLGEFTVFSHAHLCVNSFPILYQAYYREQEHREVEKEIAALLMNIESRKTEDSVAVGSGWKEHLLRNLIPGMIYTRGQEPVHTQEVATFRNFMQEFGFPEDTESILQIIESTLTFSPLVLKKLELLVSKVEALQNEDYERLEVIKRELSNL